MEGIKVSLDKVIIEYTKISMEFFNRYFVEGICVYYGIDHIIGKYGYHYELHIKKGHKVYLHIYYKPMYQKRSKHYPLRIKTHPAYLEHFSDILERLSREAKEINFIQCDVAFDIPYSLKNVFIASNTGRNMNIYEGTRYFGKRGQSSQHGYCRVYDKKKEMEEKKKVKVAGALTRVEISYRPDPKIPISQLVYSPPKFNKYYTCSVIKDLNGVKPEYRAIILAIQNQHMIMGDFTRHYRNNVKQALEAQQTVDFDALAGKHWKDIIAAPLQYAQAYAIPF